MGQITLISIFKDLGIGMGDMREGETGINKDPILDERNVIWLKNKHQNYYCLHRNLFFFFFMRHRNLYEITLW